ALPESGRAGGDRGTVEQRHAHAAHGELARGRGADDPGADDDDVGRGAQRAKPAGNGSSGSSRYCPIPVIHARPVISGTTAGRPPTSASATSRPVKRVPITDSCTNGVSR